MNIIIFIKLYDFIWAEYFLKPKFIKIRDKSMTNLLKLNKKKYK